MEYKTIIVEKKEKIAKVILNLPDSFNALDLVMREELKDAFTGFSLDQDIKVVTITGAGKAFCAGGDVTTMKGVTAPAARIRLKNVQKLIWLMRNLEKPVIAAVNGFATGAGLHIALACDLIIASENAKFRESFMMIGLIPDMGGFYSLPLRVGVAKAKELMFTGRLFDAREAESIGLVNKVVPHSELEKEVTDLAETLAQGPATVFAMIKSALNLWPMNFEASLELEANLQSVAFATKDFDEGRRAFLEKRKPEFTGE